MRCANTRGWCFKGGWRDKVLSARLSLYLQLIRWDRPAGWLLLLWPSLSALWMAADGFPGWHLVVVFVLGTVLMRSAGCCINDVADRDFDRHVKRTAQRPVTSGAVSVKEALLLGAGLALAAFALALTTNPATMVGSWIVLPQGIAFFPKSISSLPSATNVNVRILTTQINGSFPGIVFQPDGGLAEGFTPVPTNGVAFFEGSVSGTTTNGTSRMTNFETVRLTYYTGRSRPILAPPP